MKITQRQRVIDYIHEFGSISSWDAYEDLGITQLGARVKELKERGYEFETEWEHKKNRYGQPVAFKRYYIKEKVEQVC